jgi:hypothetical protein
MSYQPTFPGENITPQWLYDELQRIGTEMRAPTTVQFDILAEAPPRPVEGLIAYADGVGWNPAGVGAGLHEYRGGIWRKL